MEGQQIKNQNTPMTAELFTKLTKLVEINGYRGSRSAYIRSLIEREWARLVEEEQEGA